MRTAADLTKALGALESRLAQVASYGLRTRRITLVTVVSVIADVALTVVLAVVAVQAHDASLQAGSASAATAALHQAEISACQLNNQARAGQRTIWKFLLDNTTPQPGQEAAVAQFRALIARTFADRNCQQVYQINGNG